MYYLNVHVGEAPVTSKVKSTASSEECLVLLSKLIIKISTLPSLLALSFTSSPVFMLAFEFVAFSCKFCSHSIQPITES